jgi:site-specific recombinase XerD
MTDTILNHKSLIAEYLESRELTRTSKITYESIINLFFRFMVQSGRDATRPTAKDAIAFKYQLEVSGKSPYTIALYIMTLRTFFTWLTESGYYNQVITKGIQRIKKRITYSKLPLTKDQVQQLLSSINQNTTLGKRDAMMISMSLTTGLRVNELANVQLQDINGTHINVIRKGYTTKGQRIEIPKSILPMIEDYITERIEHGEEVTEESYLFVSHSTHPSRNLMANRVSEIIKERLKKAGIDDKKITAHSLRHTCACFLLEQGFELAVIQRFMGHSSITTTQLYTRFAEYDLLEKQKPQETLSKIIKNISLPD